MKMKTTFRILTLAVASTVYKVIALVIVTAIALAVLIWAARAEVRG